MKKIVFIGFLMLFLTSCAYFPKSKDTIQIPEIYIGTEGVEMFFLENKPPKKVYEDKIIDLGLLLWNKGTYDVNRGMYSIAVNEQYIEMADSKTGEFNVEGKTMYNPEGGREKINIRARTKKINPQLTKYSTTISTNICYDYQTKASIIVCIDTKPEEKNVKVCKPTIVSASSQGAPVAVSSIEPRMTPHELSEKILPSFIIKIKNVGNGQIIKQGRAYDVCMGESIERESYDKVNINAKLSDDILKCVPSELKIGTKQDRTLCVLEKGINKQRGAYNTPLTVQLDYGYVKTKPHTIIIEKPLM